MKYDEAKALALISAQDNEVRELAVRVVRLLLVDVMDLRGGVAVGVRFGSVVIEYADDVSVEDTIVIGVVHAALTDNHSLVEVLRVVFEFIEGAIRVSGSYNN